MLTDKSIEQYRQEIGRLNKDNTDEKKTCAVLVSPILKELGWVNDDSKRIKPQYKIPKLQNDNDGKVDYALIDGNRNPVVFVEAKKLSNQLGCEELEQLINYGSTHIIDKGNEKLAFLVLTNGDVWKFYPLWHEEGRSYYRDWWHEVSIERGNISEVTENLNKLLICRNVLDGNSSRYLKNLFPDTA